MNDTEVIAALKDAVGTPPREPVYRLDVIRARARRQRRWRWAEAVGGAVLATAVVVAVVVVDVDREPRKHTVLASSAMERAGSVRFTKVFTFGDVTLSRTSGEVDFRRGVAVVRNDRTETRLIGPERYENVPGVGWMRSTSPGPSIDLDDPRGLIDLLADFPRGTRIGQEIVRGVPTTVYRYPAASPSEPDAEVWIDADGLPRRLRVRITSPAVLSGIVAPPGVEPGSGQADAAILEIELYDYGVEVRVDRPVVATPSR